MVYNKNDLKNFINFQKIFKMQVSNLLIIKECKDLFNDQYDYFGVIENDQLIGFIKFEIEKNFGVILELSMETKEKAILDGLLRGFLNYLLQKGIIYSKSNCDEKLIEFGYINEADYCNIIEFFGKGCKCNG